MDEYGSNSHKSREDRQSMPPTEKRVDSVVAGSAKKKKKSDIRKIADVFISDDVENVKSYILLEVLIPSIKKAISDIITNGIDMILYGEAGHSKRNSSGSKVSYRSYYERENDRKKVYASQRSGYDYDDILFDTRGDAENVLDAMNDIISQYGVVSVGDLYDLSNVANDNFTANKYGWTDISGCRVIRTRDGYVLKLPKALPLN